MKILPFDCKLNWLSQQSRIRPSGIYFQKISTQSLVENRGNTLKGILSVTKSKPVLIGNLTPHPINVRMSYRLMDGPNMMRHQYHFPYENQWNFQELKMTSKRIIFNKTIKIPALRIDQSTRPVLYISFFR